MGEEMQGEGSGWRKAIPEGRDRLQSRVLVGVVGLLLAVETLVRFATGLCYGADRVR